MEKKQIRPFGVKDEIGYVFGDMAGSFVNLFVDAYFLIFCTNVLGISAGWMGTLFLVARLWDAINDPIMGSFPDRWMIGKSGDKFKPWIKIFMLPLALSGVLCFFNVPLEGIALHAYVAFAYVLWGKGPVKEGGRLVCLMRNYKNLYADLSANSGGCAIMRDEKFGLQFLEEFQDRLMFGTDMVNTDMVFPLGEWLDRQYQEGKLSVQAYRKICFENAKKIFQL